MTQESRANKITSHLATGSSEFTDPLTHCKVKSLPREGRSVLGMSRLQQAAAPNIGRRWKIQSAGSPQPEETKAKLTRSSP